MPLDPRIEAALKAPLRSGASAHAIAPAQARVPKGYGGIPGTGPIGETCASCRFCHPTGSDYRDWFCDRPRHAWHRGTFINRHTKACARFEPRKRDR
jgi:hypothetical protein